MAKRIFVVGRQIGRNLQLQQAAYMATELVEATQPLMWEWGTRDGARHARERRYDPGYPQNPSYMAAYDAAQNRNT